MQFKPAAPSKRSFFVHSRLLSAQLPMNHEKSSDNIDQFNLSPFRESASLRSINIFLRTTTATTTHVAGWLDGSSMLPISSTATRRSVTGGKSLACYVTQKPSEDCCQGWASYGWAHHRHHIAPNRTHSNGRSLSGGVKQTACYGSINIMFGGGNWEHTYPAKSDC